MVRFLDAAAYMLSLSTAPPDWEQPDAQRQMFMLQAAKVRSLHRVAYPMISFSHDKLNGRKDGAGLIRVKPWISHAPQSVRILE